MAKAFGSPITVQEHREVLSAMVDVESGMTDLIIRRTLVAENGDVVSVSKIRDTAPTQERLTELEAAVEAAAAKKIQEVDLDGVE